MLDLFAYAAFAATGLLFAYIYLNPYAKRYPNEPEIVPGALPLIGHIHKLAVNPTAFFIENFKRYGADQPYTILVGSAKFTFLPQSMVLEAYRNPEEAFSFAAAMNRIMSIDRIMGGPGALDLHYIEIITKFVVPSSIREWIPKILKEINEALDELAIDTPDAPADAKLTTTWKKLCRPLIARISATIFYGPEIGSNKEFLKLMCDFTEESVAVSFALNAVPDALVPSFIKYCTNLSKRYRTVHDTFAPIFAARRAKMDDHGNWIGPGPRPNDLLQGFIEARNEETGKWPLWENSEIEVMIRGSSMASVHTTSLYFTFMLHHIADDAGVYATLERERGEGPMTAQVLETMDHFNSILRESLRYHFEEFSFGLTHRAMQDIHFSNGVVLPEGRYITARGRRIMRETMTAEGQSGESFDPWRWSREKRVSATSAGKSFLPFGISKHICPGRFFATTEIQLAVGEIVRRFKVSTAEGSQTRESMPFGIGVQPDETPIVLSRK
ncbi:cytochrome P450 [Endogone sp. FLAS-F59071]|nr:cytochrome P450 [Endogone sp. FLAS-F59071]|eukprot:RUS21785.1 cytochrome P450 [Endogone sp. FLAS-F59071]